jgi:hypothetical protein
VRDHPASVGSSQFDSTILFYESLPSGPRGVK